jgi:dienelactone hydrolase
MGCCNVKLRKSTKPRIEVSSHVSLIDAPINIHIVGAKPKQEVTIKAHRVIHGQKRIYLSSYATFQANSDGNVVLNSCEPVEGSYTGIDGMGLFWSLHIEKIEESAEPQSIGQVLQPQMVTLSLEVDNQLIDEVIITRLWKAEHIVRERIEENGLVGAFYYHQSREAQPAIIVLGGSEGGLNETIGSLLVSHGFTVFVLAYFGMEGLPEKLVNVPVEYVKSAIDWLKNRPEVKKGWLGIHGTSKGSELALLAASIYSDIKAVVSLSGSAIAFSGIVPWSEEETLPPSWVYEDKPIPYASPINPVDVAMECRDMWQKREGDPLVKWYTALTSDPDVVERATICVEKINGPILFLTGSDDIVAGFSRIGVRRLKEHNFQHCYEHIIYSGANHSMGIPYVYYAQGKKRENTLASIDAWKRMIDFYVNSSNNSLRENTKEQENEYRNSTNT